VPRVARSAMALYKDLTDLHPSTHEAFDKLFSPGERLCSKGLCL